VQIRSAISRRSALGSFSAAALAIISVACGAAPTATPAPAKPAEPAKAAEPAKPAAAAAAPTNTPAPQAAASTPAAAAPATTGEQVTVKWMTGPPDGDSKADFDAIWNDFYAKNPGIKMEIQAHPGWEKMTALIVAKTACDIIDGCCHFLANFISQKIASDLTAYVKDWPDAKEFIPAQYKWYTREGRQFGIPTYCASHLFWFNKTKFDEMKVPYPTDDWTWEDFRRISKAVTKRTGNKTDYYGYDGSYTVNWDVPSLLWAHHEGIHDEQNNSKITLDRPKALDLLQWYADMRWADQSSPSPAEEKLYQTGNLTVFESGKGVIGYRCSWFVNYGLLNSGLKDDWDLVYPPKGPDGTRRSWITSDAKVLWSESKIKDQAWEVIKTATGVDYEKYMMKHFTLQPARTSLQPQWLENVKAKIQAKNPAWLNANLDKFVKAFEFSPTAQPHFSNHAKAMELLQPAFDQVFKTGTGKVKDVIPQAVKEANDALKDVPSTL
jgi:multiple sugar transport system substrate-binding protein